MGVGALLPSAAAVGVSVQALGYAVGSFVGL
jgi:hypothetical protein